MPPVSPGTKEVVFNVSGEENVGLKDTCAKEADEIKTAKTKQQIKSL
jgi:hypothetical protein